MKVTTNNVPRDILYAWDIPQDVWDAEFDYCGNQEESDASFFRYRGDWYDLGEFVRIERTGQRTSAFTVTSDELADQGWDGIQTDSYFSGIVVRYADDFERVVVGLYTT